MLISNFRLKSLKNESLIEKNLIYRKVSVEAYFQLPPSDKQ